MFPSGLQMLFKSLGFDPADFAAKIEAAQKAAVATVQHFDARLQAIDSRLVSIEQLLGRIASMEAGAVELNRLPVRVESNGPDPGKLTTV